MRLDRASKLESGNPLRRPLQPRIGVRQLALLLAAGVLSGGCTSGVKSSSQRGTEPTQDQVCPTRKPASSPLPGVKAEQRSAAYWIARQAEPDAAVLSPADIARHNFAFSAYDAAHPGQDALGRVDLQATVDRSALQRELDERLTYLRERVQSGKYVDRQGKRLGVEVARLFDKSAAPLPAELGQTIVVATEPIPLRCGPYQTGLYQGPKVDPAFDRNNCSTIRPQEPLRVLAPGPGAMRLVRTSYAMGWISAAAFVSPPVPPDLMATVLRGERLRLDKPLKLQGKGGFVLEAGANMMVATDDGRRALFATSKGFSRSQELSGAEAARSERPLTRRALLEEAFRYLDTPYGWGGHESGRDCSRFLMDLFAAFGLQLPRHSGLQAKAGSASIDLSATTDRSERLALLDAAAARGIVLLHFPGHIMLYLGRNAEGTPMVMHAFAEYLEPCSEADAKKTGRAETLFSVDRVQVSDLSLGRGTSRKSFLERLTRITLLAPSPGGALLGAATRRPAAPLQSAPPTKSCSSSAEVALLVSPRRPHPGEPVRVIVSAEHDLGSVDLALFGPDGRRRASKLRTLGGPPFGYWTELPGPEAGKWTAAVGEGSQVLGCVRFVVHDKAPIRQAGGGAVWQPRRRWDLATENLYATFVEQLFDYPDDDRTWPNLQVVLAAADHNILFNHLGQDEERRMTLRPDCADLPYFLRAYFSWKLRLPFAFRRCNRGFEGKAPYCDKAIESNMVSRDESGEVAAFSRFARRNVADAVHSGSGRTGPKLDYTDYYPVPLTRTALKPGTLYADPYGHLLIVADWVPQGVGKYGKLIGADAQPDGTVGRRRFWRGSFLFTPDTKESGAGFKRFRPLIYRRGFVRALKNKDIAQRPGMVPFSLEQYALSKDGFYDKMESLINPRPLNPVAALDVLVSALFEQVKRRVVSVQNGEDYKASRSGNISMPSGHSIFETSGAWENYSTPSRDMRLLIAMDTVTGFPDRVKRDPTRFGLAAGAALDSAIEALRKQLDRKLLAASISYKNSAGATRTLTLKDVVDRAKAFEMAYNPNDCVEIRWAAPAGSKEMASCKRHAPSHQLSKMRKYRSWFAERRRPAR